MKKGKRKFVIIVVLLLLINTYFVIKLERSIQQYKDSNFDTFGEADDFSKLAYLAKYVFYDIDDIPKEKEEIIRLYISSSENESKADVKISSISLKNRTLESLIIFKKGYTYICLGLDKRALWMGVGKLTEEMKFRKITDNIDIEFLPEYEKEEITVLLEKNDYTICRNEKYNFLAHYVLGELKFSADLPTSEELNLGMLSQGLILTQGDILYSVDYVTPAHSNKIEMQINLVDTSIRFAGKMEDTGCIIAYSYDSGINTYRFNVDSEGQRYILTKYKNTILGYELTISDFSSKQKVLKIYFEEPNSEEGIIGISTAKIFLPKETDYLPYDFM